VFSNFTFQGWSSLSQRVENVANRKCGPFQNPVATPVYLEMTSVPKEGSLTVIFLGNATGVNIHWPRKLPVPCPGHIHCKSDVHRSRTVWKGYAPVEVWRPKPHADWCPTVLEITERLDELLKGREYRGEVWTLCRQPGRQGHFEVTGHLIESRSPDSIRDPFCVRGVVQRVYRTTHIDFGVESPLPPRIFLSPTTSAPPPLNVTDEAQKDRPPTDAEKLEFRRKIEQMTGRRPGAASTHNGNGKGGVL
jgi:hypothetical protein